MQWLEKNLNNPGSFALAIVFSVSAEKPLNQH